ncbi:MAG: hypothetical protein WD294_16245 [Phycisphaeraceae bacterium]
MLGLMLSDRAVTVAELRLGSDRPSLQSVTRLAFDDRLSWNDPAAIGAALAQHLAEADVKTRHATLGLPAAWLLTRSLMVPPAKGEVLRQIVATKAERAFAGGGKELAIDYVAAEAGRRGAMAEQSVLLIAAQRERVTAARTMAESAGLRVDAVTATAAVLAMMHRDQPRETSRRALTLMLSEDAHELAVHTGSTLETIRPLRKVPATTQGDPGTLIADQIRQLRVLAGSPADDVNDDAGPNSLLLWDGIGLSASGRDAIAHEAGASDIDDGNIDHWVHANGSLAALSEQTAVGRYAGAIALAAVGLERPDAVIDWLHPRLAAPKRQRIGKQSQIAIAFASIVLILALAVGLHYRATANEVAFLETQLSAMSDDLATARVVVDRVALAEGWFADRPSALRCLQGVTEAFGDEPGVWATEVALQENMSGSVVGAADDGQRVLEVRDRMQASPLFGNVALIYMREAGRAGSGELGWAIAFEFQPNAAAVSQPQKASAE